MKLLHELREGLAVEFRLISYPRREGAQIEGGYKYVVVDGHDSSLIIPCKGECENDDFCLRLFLSPSVIVTLSRGISLCHVLVVIKTAPGSALGDGSVGV